MNPHYETAPMEPQESLERRASLLYDAYLKLLPDRLSEILARWHALAHGTLDDAGLEMLAQEVHRLCGSGPTFGLPQISQGLEPLDEALRGVRERGDALTAEVRQRVQGALFGLVGQLNALSTAPHHGEVVDPVEEAYVASLPHPPRIVLAEDDALLREKLALSLRAVGCEVIEAADGQEAVAAVASENPGVVLMNYHMPVMDGAAAIHRLRVEQERTDTLLYLVTTARSIEDVRAVLTCEVDGYLAKPVSARDVLQRLRQARAWEGDPTRPPAAQEARPRILIADEAPAYRKRLARHLHDAGFEPSEAQDGLTALKKIQGEAFDLVLFNAAMPVLSGLEAIRFIRRDPRLASLPMVLFTAHPRSTDVVEALSAGADAYIARPDDPAMMLGKVRTMVGVPA